MLIYRKLTLFSLSFLQRCRNDDTLVPVLQKDNRSEDKRTSRHTLLCRTNRIILRGVLFSKCGDNRVTLFFRTVPSWAWFPTKTHNTKAFETKTL